MNEFKRVRGLAIVSGIMFIVYCVVSNWNFFENIKYYSTLDIVLQILFDLIPLIALGIMLLIGKMHYGLMIPPILYALYYVVYVAINLWENYSFILPYIYRYVILMLPWLSMAFIIILCCKSLKKAMDSSVGIIGFVPAVVFLFVSFLNRFGFRTYYYGEDIFYEFGKFLISLAICFVAMILMGLWIFINIKSSGQSGTEYKNAPNQQTGQAYYRQDQGYPNSYYRQGPSGAPQQPGQGAYQSYTQHFNGQPGAQQAQAQAGARQTTGQAQAGAQQTAGQGQTGAQQATGQAQAGTQQTAGQGQANAQRPNGQPGQQYYQQYNGQYNQQYNQQYNGAYNGQYNGAYNQQYAYQQYNQAYGQQYTHPPYNQPQGQQFTHQPNNPQGNFQQGQSYYQGNFQQGQGYYQGNFAQGQQYYQQGGFPQGQQPGQQPNNMSDADKIKAFKELLDNGTITQEEFEQKKKQILGL